MEAQRPALDPMVGALLREPIRALTARVTVALAAAGFADLRPTHLTVFQQLDADGSRITDLAARSFMTKQSMGALVDDLERWGYVERIPDPSDGRARLVRRTGRGWDAERTARGAVRSFEEEWAARVGIERMNTFLDVLRDFPTGEDNVRHRPSDVPGP